MWISLARIAQLRMRRASYLRRQCAKSVLTPNLGLGPPYICHRRGTRRCSGGLRPACGHRVVARVRSVALRAAVARAPAEPVLSLSQWCAAPCFNIRNGP